MTRWQVRRARPAAPSESASAGNEFVIEDSLGYLVNRAARVMAEELANEIRPYGVGIGQWAVLMFLWAGDGVTQADLSRVVAIEPPTMVRTIDRMVRDGLVERRPDPTDARASRIHLTPKGVALRDKLVPKAVEVNRRHLETMTATERKALHRALGSFKRGQR